MLPVAELASVLEGVVIRKGGRSLVKVERTANQCPIAIASAAANGAYGELSLVACRKIGEGEGIAVCQDLSTHALLESYGTILNLPLGSGAVIVPVQGH